MPQPFTIILGKAVRYAARLRGGGSALPGLFVEKISRAVLPQRFRSSPKNGLWHTRRAMVTRASKTDD